MLASVKEERKLQKRRRKMKKYTQIQDIVSRLTDHKTFRTFFTLYLMAESEEEQERLNDRFWKDAEGLSSAEQHLPWPGGPISL